jgi:ankyrin repeat protein
LNRSTAMPMLCFFIAAIGVKAFAAADNDKVLIDALRSFFRPKVAIVRTALEGGADANARDTQGDSALHLAVRAVSPQEVNLLLEHGADVNVRDRQGRTPLMYAGFFLNPPETKKLAVAEILVKHGADVNAVDSYGKDVLSSLVPYNIPGVMAYLLEHGAAADRPDKQGRTALLYAAEEGKIDAARVLLEHGADPALKKRAAGWSPLDAAIHYKHQDIAELMLAHVKPAQAGAGLISAASEGNQELVARLLEEKADINVRNEAGMTALMAAVDRGRTDIVQTLLQAGADPNAVDKPGYGSLNGETALCLAGRKKMEDVVPILIKAKADLDAPCGAMVQAAQAGSRQIVKLLADAGADVQDRFTGNWRALFVSAESGDAAITGIMLEHGTPVDMRDDQDSTALMVAAGKGNLDVIRVLAAHKADLEAVNAKRPMNDVGSNLIGTPVMWAMEAGQKKAVELLLSLGAKPKTVNSYPSLPSGNIK